MKPGATRQLAIGLMVAVMGTFAWIGVAEAFKGGIPQCLADLTDCEANAQTFPGDGYPEDDSFGTSGHGPALSYVDNGDLTVTDINTGYMWEQKLPIDDVGGSCDELLKENRSVHCPNNGYDWSALGSTDPDGDLWTEFLYTLNNTCAADALLKPADATDCSAQGDADCEVENGGPGGLCGFAGYQDWEIPNVKKLQSIVDYSVDPPPLIDPIFGPAGLPLSKLHWSSTTTPSAISGGSGAYVVSFESGDVGGMGKPSGVFARAVRGGPVVAP